MVYEKDLFQNIIFLLNKQVKRALHYKEIELIHTCINFWNTDINLRYSYQFSVKKETAIPIILKSHTYQQEDDEVQGVESVVLVNGHHHCRDKETELWLSFEHHRTCHAINVDWLIVLCFTPYWQYSSQVTTVRHWNNPLNATIHIKPYQQYFIKKLKEIIITYNILLNITFT